MITKHTLLGSALGLALLLGSTDLGPATAVAAEPPAIAAFASAEDPPAFDDPAQAVAEFKARLAADDFDGFAKLLGLDAGKLRTSAGVMEVYSQIRQGAAKQVIVRQSDDRQILNLGSELWPLPFPLRKYDDGKWAFDTYAGFEEIINRRIGENEIEAIATARAYVEAQRDYASDDRDGDGVIEFAQKLISTEGTTDGLYWPIEQGDGDSPAGSFVDQGALEKSKAGQGYFGYRYRILTGQGDNVAGGKYSYLVNDNLIAGFGLVAWPVKYAETGVNSFVVNNAGIVYEKDLGDETEKLAAEITEFSPDDSWAIAKD